MADGPTARLVVADEVNEAQVARRGATLTLLAPVPSREALVKGVGNAAHKVLDAQASLLRVVAGKITVAFPLSPPPPESLDWYCDNVARILTTGLLKRCPNVVRTPYPPLEPVAPGGVVAEGGG